jgi:hypothetical protein
MARLGSGERVVEDWGWRIGAVLGWVGHQPHADRLRGEGRKNKGERERERKPTHVRRRRGAHSEQWHAGRADSQTKARVVEIFKPRENSIGIRGYSNRPREPSPQASNRFLTKDVHSLVPKSSSGRSEKQIVYNVNTI